MVPAREAFDGNTLETRMTSSRRPSIASATTSSAPPSAYISAVSISDMPRSSPSFSAAISAARADARTPMFQVPWPRTGIGRPSRSFSWRKRSVPEEVVEFDGARRLRRGGASPPVLVDLAEGGPDFLRRRLPHERVQGEDRALRLHGPEPAPCLDGIDDAVAFEQATLAGLVEVPPAHLRVGDHREGRGARQVVVRGDEDRRLAGLLVGQALLFEAARIDLEHGRGGRVLAGRDDAEEERVADAGAGEELARARRRLRGRALFKKSARDQRRREREALVAAAEAAVAHVQEDADARFRDPGHDARHAWEAEAREASSLVRLVDEHESEP